MKGSVGLKERILEVAKAIAYEEGISAINMRRIAAESNISVGAIYNYYATKGDITAAVIEDFWMTAFNVSKIESCACMRVVDCFEFIYSRLAKFLIDYKSIWLGQLSQMDHMDKKIGKAREKSYFSKVQNIFLNSINNDTDISESLWENGLTKEEFSKFLLVNMLALLKGDKRDCSHFVHILNRILYL